MKKRKIERIGYLVHLHGRPVDVMWDLEMVNDYIKKHPKATYSEYSCPRDAISDLDKWIADNRLKTHYDDGGRSAAGFKERAGDCAVRSIAIVTGLTYQEVYDGIIKLAAREDVNAPPLNYRSHPEFGVRIQTTNRFMMSAGHIWVRANHTGGRYDVHLRKGELPNR